MVRKKKWEVGFAFFFGITAMLSFIFFVALPLMDFKTALAAEHWPTTGGTVTSLGYYHQNSKGCHYHIKFFYHYKVDSKDYTNNRFMFGSAPCSWSEAHDVVGHYAEGGDILVHYLQSNPAQSVIVPGKLNGNSWTGIIGFSIISPLLAWMSIRSFQGKIWKRKQ